MCKWLLSMHNLNRTYGIFNYFSLHLWTAYGQHDHLKEENENKKVQNTIYGRSWSNRKKGDISWVYVVEEQDATVGYLVSVHSVTLATYHTALNKEICKNTILEAGSVAQTKLRPAQRWGWRLPLGAVLVASGCLLQVQARVESLVW